MQGQFASEAVMCEMQYDVKIREHPSAGRFQAKSRVTVRVYWVLRIYTSIAKLIDVIFSHAYQLINLRNTRCTH